MTNPSENTPPVPEGCRADLVPGIPPVPITIWRTPTTDGQQLGHRLFARLLAAYSHPGDLVYDTTGNQTLRQAAGAADRRYTTTTSGKPGAGMRAALAVTCWPPDPTMGGDNLLRGIRRRLRTAGILAVVTTGHTGTDTDIAGLVDTAITAGLAYLQHIVAVHAATADDHFTHPHPDTGTPAPVAGPAGAAHLRVHTDLYILQAVAAAHA